MHHGRLPYITSLLRDSMEGVDGVVSTLGVMDEPGLA